jgi:peptidoglycan hydrolase-like protein with peptidoglycan-binding domain
MTSTLPLAFLALAAAAAPAAAAERGYSVTDFDRVQVDGPFEVSVTSGLASAARVEGSAEAIDRISVEVFGTTLRVRANRSAWGGYPGERPGPARITLTTREVRAAAVVGSGSLVVDRAKGLRVDLSVNGSGRLSVGAVDADNLVVGLLGGGRITLAGRAKQVKATIQGSGDLHAAELSTDDARILADTAGSVVIGVTRTANVTATGAGDVEIIGEPSCTVDSKGSGQVLCGRGR